MIRILCVGLATVDLVYGVPVIPRADEKAQASSLVIAAGGPAANAAVAASALGAEVTLVTAVGAHPLGDLVREDLRERGVRLVDVDPHYPGPPPVSSVIVREPGGERTIVSRNGGDRAARVPEGGLPDADLTLVDGHHPALAVAAARAARRLLVDAGSWRPVFREIFPHAEVVACSAAFRHPAAAATSAATVTGSSARADAAVAAAIGAPHVAVTHGPAPVTWFSGGRSGVVAVPRVAAVDTAGAGDAFHGALAVALARGEELPVALASAVRVAGVRVVHPGPRAWLDAL
ncbi:PfkB family carbohydrate kinase [Actinoplanes sp. NPDC051411]|uniref:PfkB family carbohydrate kinase n=1 Tax=Actinoplanes sp. NPDC051411 TaxID=3155522 RepID=UPI003432467E